jgi:RNA polymerase sigma factor (TIGR02999 family)
MVLGKNFEDDGIPRADRQALDDLFASAYQELRRLAATVRRGDPAATLNPTALVNEAWLKMARSAPVGAMSELHFKRIAARAMRQILVEAARRKQTGKRGGGRFITFNDSLGVREEKELLGLDEALKQLAQMRPRQALMIEARFFGGLEVTEVAELLDVSEATILREWRAAKAWLAQELRRV